LKNETISKIQHTCISTVFVCGMCCFSSHLLVRRSLQKYWCWWCNGL